MFIVPFFRSAGRSLLQVVALVAATSAALLAQTPSAADGFDPDVDGNVYVVVAQPDGRLLIGGQFTAVRGFPRNNVARLNVDGSLDDSFNPNANGPVRALALDANNRIVIGGDFTSLQPGGSGAAVTRNRLARLNADGSLDTAFTAGIGAALPPQLALTPQVFALAVQADGGIVVGGTFGSAQSGTAAAVTRTNLARFTAAGALDTAFDPTVNGVVLALAIHVDRKIVIGGGFTSLWPAGDSVPSTRNRLARLNPNGTVDSEFNPNANNAVSALAIQRDGKILLGGVFTTLQPPSDDAPANRIHLARLNVNGTLDSEFYPRVEGNVTALALQGDGSIVVGGTFASVWGRGSTEGNRSNLARFLPDGSLDANFAPALNAAVDTLAALPDGRVVAGGHFTRVLAVGATAGLIRNHLARINADGSFDAGFELDAGGRILASVTQTDGKVVIAGTFTNVGGTTHNYVARLNADGTVDNAYKPDFNGRVYTLAYDAASNKVIAGGEFTTVGTDTRNHIVRLNGDGALAGTVDSEFYPSLDGQVGAIAIQSDGKILVGGAFTNVQEVGATTPVTRAHLLRLNPNGKLDTAFDPEPNSSVASILIQSDGKIVIGGLFTTVQPGGAPTVTTTNGVTTTTLSTATITSRNNLARLNADGTLDTTFNPQPNGQVTAIVAQSDGKLIIAGAFTALNPVGAPAVTTTNADGTKTTTTVSTRARLARLNTDGTVDAAYDPNPNINVLALALQSDGKLILGGTFTTLQPLQPTAAATFTLRKYAARVNTDGTVDPTFNLDLNEQPGNRVDSIRIQPDGRVFLGGSFTSLQPSGTAARLTRRNFVRLLAGATPAVDPNFDVSAGGSTGAIVNALAIQPDGKVIVGGSFSDLGGAKTTNLARFRAEGLPDSSFSPSLATDGPVNAIALRPNIAATPSQVGGFAWLNADGTLRTTFKSDVRLSGTVSAVAVDRDGRILLGGSFANLDYSLGGGLVRLRADGKIDPTFNYPAPNGQVTGLVVQNDGRIVVVGSFTVIGGVTRNNIARLDDKGAVDVTYDPNASARISSIVKEADGRIVVGGDFTTFTPNATATAVARNYLARVNEDGTIDANYNPSPNAPVNALALQGDGKVIAGGAFNSVVANGAVAAVTRNYLARFNSDGSLDQNFDPNANSVVNALAFVPATGQMIVGGAFTTLQPAVNNTLVTRNNLARLNSDGAVDTSFDPNPNGAVTTVAVEAGGTVLIGGTFTTLQPNGTTVAITRSRFARLNANGAPDLNFNPDPNGAISLVAAGPANSVFVAGSFSGLQLSGSIYVAGAFKTIGGVNAQNFAALNDNGSVSPTFQPRPDGAVNAVLVLPDGRAIVGGAFTNIAGVARNRIARFNADGTLDAGFAPNIQGAVMALALQGDGKIIVGGATSVNGTQRDGIARLNVDGSLDAAFAPQFPSTFALPTGLAVVQPDGRVLVVVGSARGAGIVRLTPAGAMDETFSTTGLFAAARITSVALQSDGRLVVATELGVIGASTLVRLNPNGSLDALFNPAPNGRVNAVALQPDGRVMIGGGFTNVGGQQRVGLARLAATGAATSQLGVSANRTTVTWNRGGTTGDLSSVRFEQSTDLSTWTVLGDGVRTGTAGDWQRAGLNLPASGLFYLRARGIAPSGGGTSSGIFEAVREFNFTNPIAAAAAPIAQVPAQAASPSLVFDPVTGIAPRATVTMVAGEGTVEILAASAPLASSVFAGAPAQLANLSTRGRVSPSNPLILGFAIAGTENRRVLVRAVGPGLAGFGVTDALGATRLQIFDAAGTLRLANEGWANAADLTQAAAATGAFPLRAGSADSAALVTLSPGNYSLVILDPRGGAGVALAEIYDADTGAGSRLVNVSSRGIAGTGDAALISGFVIAGGGATERLLLRAVGPGLVRFGTTGSLADPAIALYDAEGRLLGTNDNWVSSLATISTAAASVGAFALDPGSKDAAVLATLPSGAYTIQVTGPSVGTGLLEIYELK